MVSRCIRNEKVISNTQRFKIIFAEGGVYFSFPALTMWILMDKTKLRHLFLFPGPFYLFIPLSVLWPIVTLVKH